MDAEVQKEFIRALGKFIDEQATDIREEHGDGPTCLDIVGALESYKLALHASCRDEVDDGDDFRIGGPLE